MRVRALELQVLIGISLMPSAGLACGGRESPREPVDGSGPLLIEKALADGPIFAEGSVTHLRIAGDDGRAVVDALHPIETLDVPLADLGLPEGAYTVTAVERPCQGNCDYLDPPARSTRCELRVHILADRTIRIAIVLGAGPAGPESHCSPAGAGDRGPALRSRP